jgi:hypothetical protein
MHQQCDFSSKRDTVIHRGGINPGILPSQRIILRRLDIWEGKMPSFPGGAGGGRESTSVPQRHFATTLESVHCELEKLLLDEVERKASAC